MTSRPFTYHVRLRDGYHQGNVRVLKTDVCLAQRIGVIWLVCVDEELDTWKQFSMRDVDIIPGGVVR